MKLHKAPRYAKVRLVEFPVSPRHMRRVSELGLRPGVVFVVAQQCGLVGTVINVAGSRIAVDRASARRMAVDIVEKNS
ncbi:ferrous iron transport protein A [Trueperella sp. LYQ143]|uniref:FeoA family protein n=1 Tax=unclassified Trueperella TaxID=2630174 RepID=UPI00398374BE